MSKDDELRAAAQFLTNQKRSKDKDKNPAVWLWEAIQGDFNQGRSGGQIGFDAAVSMIPGVDQICDLRDLVANCILIKKTPGDGWNWVSLGLTLIGLFPTLGSPVKGVLKIFVLFIRNVAADKVAKGIDHGLTWAVTWLRKKEVQKYLRLKKVDEIFGWLATELKTLRGSVTARAMLAEFDKAISTLKGLLGKVAAIPYVGTKAKESIALVEEVRRLADTHIGNAVKPIQEILDKIIDVLERKHLMTRQGITDLSNIHFKGGLPEAQAVSLMRTRKPRPDWLSEGLDGEFPKIDPSKLSKGRAKAIFNAISEGHPSPGDISRFNRIAPDTIEGPARLYRIVSPTSMASSDCWVTAEIFNKLQSASDPKAAWRKYLAVWPHWNANGQFVTYDIKAGEKLKVWRGEASSQILDPSMQFDGHLQGGWEQVVFQADRKVDTKTGNLLENDSNIRAGAGSLADTGTYYAVDRATGKMEPAPDMNYRRYKSLESEDQGKYEFVRERINNPAISGPFETGWGYTDFEPQAAAATLGLPDLAGQTSKMSH